jgi:hypothetical protein
MQGSPVASRRPDGHDRTPGRPAQRTQPVVCGSRSALSWQQRDADVELVADVGAVAADPQALGGPKQVQVLAAHAAVLGGFHDSARPVAGSSAPIPRRLTAPGPAESLPWGCPATAGDLGRRPPTAGDAVDAGEGAAHIQGGSVGGQGPYRSVDVGRKGGDQADGGLNATRLWRVKVPLGLTPVAVLSELNDPPAYITPLSWTNL